MYGEICRQHFKLRGRIPLPDRKRYISHFIKGVFTVLGCLCIRSIPEIRKILDYGEPDLSPFHRGSNQFMDLKPVCHYLKRSEVTCRG